MNQVFDLICIKQIIHIEYSENRMKHMQYLGLLTFYRILRIEQ